MTNDTNTNHINCKRNPRSFSKLTHNNKHIFTRPGSFNGRGKANVIPLYIDNYLAGKDNNCRNRKNTNLNQNLQTCSNQIPTSATNTDKNSEVEEYGNSIKNLPIHHQKIYAKRQHSITYETNRIVYTNFLVRNNFKQIRRYPHYR